MRFVKNFNNNAALVVDDWGREWVVLGNGVGFGKHAGQPVDDGAILRRFKAAGDVTTLPTALAVATRAVVALVEAQLRVQLAPAQAQLLAAHIRLAAHRAQAAPVLPEASAQWELTHLFPQEFQAATAAVALLNGVLARPLAPIEAVFLTYHLITLTAGQAAGAALGQLNQLMRGVIDLVAPLDVTSYAYAHFVTHLRALLIRLMHHEVAPVGDAALTAQIAAAYAPAFATVQAVGQYLMRTQGWVLTPADQLDLTLDVWRITHGEPA
ncbi:CAT RNA binding domain-containing protein [Lacticaseibacillus absianus]|uniref:CAT RNA binding domain-containing protein n=1 Tax=Lacticaseibacillus absianus TaxID=2729623 RepID=UPI0015C87406